MPKPTPTPMSNERIKLPGGWDIGQEPDLGGGELVWWLFKPDGRKWKLYMSDEHAKAFAAAMNGVQSPAGEWRSMDTKPNEEGPYLIYDEGDISEAWFDGEDWSQHGGSVSGSHWMEPKKAADILGHPAPTGEVE